MERTVSDYSDPSARSTVHIPRLRIRATSQSTNSILSTSTSDAATFTSRNRSVTSLDPSITPSEAISGFHSRRPSINDHPLPTSKASKKKGFFSSLFSVKEPSLQALADYEKQLKTAGTPRRGRVAAATLPGVSSAKLPAHVPKTNSRWDGNPATANRVYKKDQEPCNDMLKPPSKESVGQRSLPSSSSDSLRPSMRRPASRATLSATSVYTSHSDGSRNQLADLYGWEVADFSRDGDSSSSTAGTRAASLRSTSTSAAASEDRPSLTMPRIPNEYLSIGQDTRPGTAQMPGYSHSPALTPRDELPLTPTSPSPVKPFASVDPQQTLRGEHEVDERDIHGTEVNIVDSSDEVVLTSNGLNILSPPITTRQKSSHTTQKTHEQPKHDNRKEPKSILKKESVQAVNNDESYQQSTLDTLASQTAVLDFYHGPQWKRKMGVNTVRRGQRVPTVDDAQGERSGSPTPEGGSKVQQRKSIVGTLKP